MPYAVKDKGVVMVGFTQLNQALSRISGRGNFGLDYELQRRLRLIGNMIASAAPGFVTHRTGRHGDPSVPRLEDSVRVSVTSRTASVYSIAVHGGVQNVGGGPHAGWAARGPHVRKDRASGWMNKAVASKEQLVEEQLEGLLDWVVDEFYRDKG
jgi:hypothetical protein